MTDADQLESILNFELIEELDSFFANKDKNEVIESLLIFSEEAFSALKSQALSLNKNQYLWIGLTNYQNKNLIKIKTLDSHQYTSFHELYRTDANILIGHAKFNIKSNTFIPTEEINFFIESWEGSMVGSYSPFKVTQDNFRYKKSA